jgi:hypothetical protein
MQKDPMRRLQAAFAGRADVDYTAGLYRVSGNAELYIELLRSFFSGDGMARLCRAVADGDDASARWQAHLLRREAAGLGLVGIAEPAAALGRAIGENPWRALELAQQMQETYRAIQATVHCI